VPNSRTGHVAGLGFELTYPTPEDAQSRSRPEPSTPTRSASLDAILAANGWQEREGADRERLEQLITLVEAFERWHPDHRIVDP